MDDATTNRLFSALLNEISITERQVAKYDHRSFNYVGLAVTTGIAALSQADLIFWALAFASAYSWTMALESLLKAGRSRNLRTCFYALLSLPTFGVSQLENKVRSDVDVLEALVKKRQNIMRPGEAINVAIGKNADLKGILSTISERAKIS